MVCYDGNTWQGDNRAPISNVIQVIGAYQDNIIHGGDFSFIGDQVSPFVAQLDVNENWNRISQLSWLGGSQGSVEHLQEFNGELYATGLFDSANGSVVQGIACLLYTSPSPRD